MFENPGTERDGVSQRGEPDGHRQRGDATRRRFLAAGAAAAAVGLAGCSAVDVLTGDEPAEFAAGTATVGDAALADSGYELHEITSRTVTQEFEAAGSTREVVVTNRTAEYDKAIELFGQRYQAAVFTALATPRVEVLGTAFNPVGDMDSEELAELIQDRYDDVDNVERSSEYTTEILGEDTTVVVYRADGTIQGTSFTVDLEMHIADPVEAGDDYVIALAAYPEVYGDGENVRRMMNGIEHRDE